MTMVMVPAVNGGEVCLNPDTAGWILPAAVGETCQVLMAGGTVYDIAMDVRGMKEIFADSFIQLMLAEPMPSKPGFVLVNPEAIDQRRVTLDFQQVPAMSAMQLVADQDGLRVVFDGRRVRFESKS